MQPLIRRSTFQYAILPPICRHCAQPLLAHVGAPSPERGPGFPHLCHGCQADLPWLDGMAETPEIPYIDEVYAPLIYSSPVAGWIRSYKYYRQENLVILLGMLLAEASGLPALDKDALVVPVPLHWTRHVWRGFNQSGLLAEAWLSTFSPDAEGSSLDVRHLLRRVRWTRSQVKMKAETRRENLQGAIAVAKRELDRGTLEGKRVLLVDDVLTTGTTLAVCGKALREAGASRVEALVLAIARADWAHAGRWA